MVLAWLNSFPMFLAAMNFLQESEREGTPIWVPIIIIIVLILIFLAAYFTSSGIKGDQAAATGQPDAPDDPYHEPAKAVEPDVEASSIQTEVAPTALADAPEKAVTVPAEQETAVVLPEKKETAVTMTEEAPAPEPAQADDLKIIEGIGPKIERILKEAGIGTFVQLAAADVGQLENIVREDAGIRIAFPATWPEQAKLAADGLWDALEKLQDDLKGGRRA